jgi:hypothetical protein
MMTAYQMRVAGDVPESASRIAGSCRPMRAKRSAFKRKKRISQTAVPWSRICGVVSSGVYQPM